MVSKVKISVIIPTYNQEKYIGRCLRSLLDQSFQKDLYELIVINDGSNDKTNSVLNLYKKDIKLIINEKNEGLPFSINRGITSAKGRYVVRVDSDDYVNKEFLNSLSLFLSQNSKMDAVCCDYYFVDDDENIIERKNAEKNPIGCAIMFRTEHLIDLGMYDQTFLVHEDLDLRLRFLKKYKINRIPLPLYRYRKHEANLTKNQKTMDQYFRRLKSKHKI